MAMAGMMAGSKSRLFLVPKSRPFPGRMVARSRFESTSRRENMLRLLASGSGTELSGVLVLLLCRLLKVSGNFRSELTADLLASFLCIVFVWWSLS